MPAAPASTPVLSALEPVGVRAAITDIDWQSMMLLWSMRLIGALLILVIGLWLARKVSNLLERSLSRFDRADPILRSFVRNAAYAALALVVIVAALTQIGVPPASLVTVLGAAGLAIGLALKDSLSNIASGVMLMGLRPFHAGDAVRIGGIEGIVEQVRIFTTRLRTPQNEDILIPNSEITKAPIVNYTARPQRRIDATLTLLFDQPIEEARRLLVAAGERVTGILADPPVECAVARFDEIGVALTLSGWVNTPDYVEVKGNMLQEAHATLRANGVRLASRHTLVHMAPQGTDTSQGSSEIL